MCERDDEANRAVAAHAEATDVVEEDDAADAGLVLRLNKQRANNDVRPAWLIYDSRAESIEITLKGFTTIIKRAGAEIRSTGDDDTCRLAAGVGVNDFYLMS
jgi:hypothetical protein